MNGHTDSEQNAVNEQIQESIEFKLASIRFQTDDTSRKFARTMIKIRKCWFNTDGWLFSWDWEHKAFILGIPRTRTKIKRPNEDKTYQQISKAPTL